MIRLAFPDNTLYNDLLNFPQKLIDEKKIQIFRLPEEMCFEYLINNRVEAAFLNPLTYGKGLNVSDFRIIRASVFMSENKTNLASIVFNKGIKTITDCYSKNPNDFLINIGKILLTEKFNIQTELKYSNLSIGEILKSGSTSVNWNFGENDGSFLDISEEWYDQYEIPVPLGFWVCHAEEYPENLEQIINLSYCKEDERKIQPVANEHEWIESEGRLIYNINDDFIDSLEHTLHLLYYHQYFNAIPAIKVLGQEKELEI